MDVYSAVKYPQPDEGWRHYKGTLYRIVGIGHDTETQKAVVVYSRYGDDYSQRNLWVRPLDMFMGLAGTDEHGRPIDRFKFEREPKVLRAALAETEREGANG